MDNELYSVLVQVAGTEVRPNDARHLKGCKKSHLADTDELDECFQVVLPKWLRKKIFG